MFNKIRRQSAPKGNKMQIRENECKESVTHEFSMSPEKVQID